MLKKGFIFGVTELFLREYTVISSPLDLPVFLMAIIHKQNFYKYNNSSKNKMKLFFLTKEKLRVASQNASFVQKVFLTRCVASAENFVMQTTTRGEGNKEGV